MEIKANSWYRTRGGEIAYVAAIVPFPRMYPGVGIADDNLRTWTLDGTYDINSTREYDLIDHLPDCDSFDWVPKPKIKLEAGKKYVLVNGDVVGPMDYSTLGTTPAGFNWRALCGSRFKYWNDRGIRYVPNDQPTENIISEYIEPVPTYEPWGFDDVIVGSKVLDKPSGAELLITGKAKRATSVDRVCINGSWSDADMVLRNYTQLDGTPCGRVKQ